MTTPRPLLSTFVGDSGTSGFIGQDAITRARSAGWSDEDIRTAASLEGLQLGVGAAQLLGTTGTSTDGPGTWSTTYPVGPGLGFGLPTNFSSFLDLPTGTTYMSPFEIDMLQKNLENSWELNKETELTNLRGQISKELSQLNFMTELGKTALTGNYTLQNTGLAGEYSRNANLIDQQGQDFRAALSTKSAERIADKQADAAYNQAVQQGRSAFLSNAIGNFNYG